MKRVDYLSLADSDEKRWGLITQDETVKSAGRFRCRCVAVVTVKDGFRCLYCGEWFCFNCAEEHFGLTVEDWIKQRRERRIPGCKPFSPLEA